MRAFDPDLEDRLGGLRYAILDVGKLPQKMFELSEGNLRLTKSPAESGAKLGDQFEVSDSFDSKILIFHF